MYDVVLVTEVAQRKWLSNSLHCHQPQYSPLRSLLAADQKPQLWCLALVQDNELQMIVRAHECVMDGFERFAQGHLITLFSATNYCGTANNAGAILVPPLRRRRGCRARPGSPAEGFSRVFKGFRVP